MIAFIFVAIVVMFILLSLAFTLKIYTLGLLSSIGLVIIGVYTAINGIEDITSILAQGMSVIIIWSGLYVFVRGSVDKIEELF